MNSTEIQALLAGNKKSSTGGKGYAIVRDAETGKLDKVPISDVSSVGQFEGRSGTLRRSRKGRVSRNANGRRFYCHNYDVEIVSYLSKS